MGMTDIAKNLLEGKTCNACWYNLVSNYPGKCLEPKTKKHRTLPKNNTCENWAAQLPNFRKVNFCSNGNQ